ncbi:hypothetical protein ACHWQZ_G010890 [Mnemiopsis leidyi]
MLHLLLAVFFGAALANDGWIAVERGVYINYDLENSPLQIKTGSVVGSYEKESVLFRTAHDDHAGDVSLFFTSPPQYRLDYCSTSWTNLPTVLPTETNKVWTITLSRFSAPECTGLKTEWTSTIETTTQFPVLPGTVVTVTCLDSDAVNVGSSEVTCTKETDYTFSIEPSCSTPDTCKGLIIETYLAIDASYSIT